MSKYITNKNELQSQERKLTDEIWSMLWDMSHRDTPMSDDERSMLYKLILRYGGQCQSLGEVEPRWYVKHHIETAIKSLVRLEEYGYNFTLPVKESVNEPTA